VDAGQRGGHPRQCPARVEARRAEEVRGEIAVAEREPRGLAEPAERAETGERVAREAPPAPGVRAARERIEDGVEVGRDVEPEEDLVVARVADDRQASRVDDAREAAEEPCPADAAGERSDGGQACCGAAAVWPFGATRP